MIEHPGTLGGGDSTFHGTITYNFNGRLLVPVPCNGEFNIPVPHFSVPDAKFKVNWDSPEPYSLTGYVGPTQLHLEFDDRPDWVIKGILAHPIGDKFSLRATFRIG